MPEARGSGPLADGTRVQLGKGVGNMEHSTSSARGRRSLATSHCWGLAGSHVRRDAATTRCVIIAGRHTLPPAASSLIWQAPACVLDPRARKETFR